MNRSQHSLAPEFEAYLRKLFPICRSLTGDGNRASLRVLNEIVPIVQHEVKSGTPVYDWIIPDEWAIRGAWIAAPDGTRVVDFQQSNLHVVGYSEPVRLSLGWDELKSHLFTHPSLPNAIPYRSSYYKRDWGFCVTARQYDDLRALRGPFDVVIDSDLKPGSLTYGECLLPGKSSQEILLSCYICHPSMANDSLSGVLLTAFLGRYLANLRDRRCSYRLVFVPETVGAIAYCAANEFAMKQIDMGLVITTVGGPGKFGYKQSWDPSHRINHLIEQVLCEQDEPFLTYPFDVHGSDERQYSSPGFRINCATISKDRYYEYPEYHSSLDNLDLVNGDQIAQTFDLYRRLIDKFEARRVYRRCQPYGEVMLSRRQLYPTAGGNQWPVSGVQSELDLILRILFLCDARTALSEISDKLAISASALDRLIDHLQQIGVINEV